MLAGSASDDGLPLPPSLTTTWSQTGGPVGAATFNDGTATDTAVSFTTNGVYELTLTADDGALTSTDTVTITVTTAPVNTAPVVDAGPDQSIELPADAVLAGSASDDGLPLPPSLTTTWSQTGGPVGAATFNDENATDTAVSFTTNGVYELTLTADDGALTSTDTVTITVTTAPVNTAPVVDAGPDQSIELPADAVLAGSASDDGLPLPPSLTTTWSQTGGPVGAATFNDENATDTAVSFTTNGVYELTLTADDGALTSTDTVTITVTTAPVNTAPVVDAGPDQSIELPADAVLAGSASDDGLPLPPSLTTTWSQTGGPVGAATFNDENATDTAVSFTTNGVYELTLTADDGALTSTDTVTITVTTAPVNTAPVVDAGPDQSIELPADAVLAGSASDDGLPLPPSLTTTWSQTGGPVGAATFNDENATDTAVSFTTNGVYELTLTADDGALTSTDTVTITVTTAPVNTAPVVDAGPDQSIELPADAVLAGSASDDGLPLPPSLTTTWSQTGGPVGAATFNDENATDTAVSFTTNGVYELTLTADDGALTSTDTVTITVTTAPVNTAPVVDAGPDQSIELPADAVLAGSASDDGLPLPPSLTTTWSQTGGPVGAATFNDENATDTAVSFTTNGVYELTLTADDGALTSTDTVTITVTTAPVNTAPVVDAGPDQSIELPADAVLAGSASDDGLPLPPSLTTTWSQTGGPVGAATFNDENATDTAVSFTTNGVYELTLTADDGALTSTDTVTITVTTAPVNTAPVVDAGPDQSIELPADAVLAGSASDDGLPLPPSLTTTWSQTGGPVGAATFNDENATDTAVSFTTNGVYELTLTADDGALTSTDTVTITVTTAPVNTAPVVDAGPDQSIELPADAVLAGSASDDGLPLPPSLTTTWSQTGGPVGAATFNDENATDTAVSFTTNGVYELTLTADDGALTSTDTVTITVTTAPVNTAPVVDAGPDQSIELPADAVLAGSASDDGLPLPPSLTTTWSQTGGPVGAATFNDENATDTAVSFTTNGVYELTLTADDGALTSTDTVTITVTTAPVNTAPVVDAGPDQSIELPADAVLAGSASDDGLPLPPSLTTTWSQTGGPVGAATFNDENATDTAVSFTTNGVYELTLTADDGALTSTDTVTITVTTAPVNTAPVVDAGPDQSIELPADAVLAGSASDDGLPLPPSLTTTWSQTGGPVGAATFNDENATDTAVSFTTNGVYELTLTADDGALTSTDTVTITVTTAPAQLIYLSFTSGTSVPGIAGTVRDEDIVTYDSDTGVWALFFDASDVGITISDLNAFHVRSDGSVLMSFSSPVSIPGLIGGPDGTGIDDSDLVLFEPTSTGDDTSGSFTFFLDGSDIDLTTNSEDIDGIFEFSDGTLGITTTGSIRVGSLAKGGDEDIHLFTPTATGAVTTGTWTGIHFDGSDVGLTDRNDDLTSDQLWLRWRPHLHNAGGQLHARQQQRGSEPVRRKLWADYNRHRRPRTGPLRPRHRPR